MRLDLDLVLFHFSDVWDDDPQAAVRAVEALLRDRSACQARIEMLRRLEARAQERRPHLPPLPLRGDFGREIALLANPGLVEAVDRGLLSPDRIAALTGDPDALWAAHRAVSRGSGRGLSPSGGESVETEVESGSEETAAPALPGFTELARHERWEELERRLGPWLPSLLGHVGLSEEMAGPLMEFILKQAPRLGGRRFSELLPQWLEEFARSEGAEVRRSLRTEDEWRDYLEPGAFRLVFEASGPDEPAWAKQFREAALEEGICSSAGLLDFEPRVSASSAEAVAAFRRDLLFEASQKREEGKRLFERD